MRYAPTASQGPVVEVQEPSLDDIPQHDPFGSGARDSYLPYLAPTIRGASSPPEVESTSTSFTSDAEATPIRPRAVSERPMLLPPFELNDSLPRDERQ